MVLIKGYTVDVPSFCVEGKKALDGFLHGSE